MYTSYYGNGPTILTLVLNPYFYTEFCSIPTFIFLASGFQFLIAIRRTFVCGSWSKVVSTLWGYFFYADLVLLFPADDSYFSFGYSLKYPNSTPTKSEHFVGFPLSMSSYTHCSVLSYTIIYRGMNRLPLNYSNATYFSGDINKFLGPMYCSENSSRWWLGKM